MHTRNLSARDGRTLLLAALGGALEFYDFIIFVYFAATIGALFFPTDMPERGAGRMKKRCKLE